MKKTSFASVLTFGCQMNIHDSEYLKSELESLGYTLINDYIEAEAIVINTCSVREKPETKLLNILSQIKGLKKKKPKIKVIVCGCSAQNLGSKIIELYPFVDLVFGPDEIFNFKNLLLNLFTSKKESTHTSFYKDFSYMNTKVSSNILNHAYLTVMKGCNSYCSYCIVPYLRGKEISRKRLEIVEDVKQLVDKGISSITLIAQNISRYGLDINDNLINLIIDISKINRIKNLAFLTSHPKDFDLNIIKLYEDIDILSPLLHLPAQHGSNKILASMNRNYTKEYYYNIVDNLKNSKIWKNLNFTTDIIIGFPEEDDNDFKELLSLLDYAEFDNSFTFIYSPRKGTKAYELYSKKTDLSLKKVYSQRLKMYQDRQKEIALQKNKNLLDKTMELYIEQDSYKDSLKYTARTKSYKVVNFIKPKDIDLKPGSYVLAKIDKAYPTHLLATFISKV